MQKSRRPQDRIPRCFARGFLHMPERSTSVPLMLTKLVRYVEIRSSSPPAKPAFLNKHRLHCFHIKRCTSKLLKFNPAFLNISNNISEWFRVYLLVKSCLITFVTLCLLPGIRYSYCFIMEDSEPVPRLDRIYSHLSFQIRVHSRQELSNHRLMFRH